MNVPKLRFGEFSGEWEHLPAEQLFENIAEKNCSSEKVLTIIQGTGTVLRENSGRDILFDKTTTDNYKKVQKGDFIIHLRSFQAGLEIANSDGIVSPAYTILRSKKAIGTMFYRNYFRSDRFINQTLCSAVEGVRDGRQISYSRFKQIPIVSTTLPEQQKIAEFLSAIDEKINNQESIVASLEAQKKCFMQQIFSRELRFKDENSSDFPEWKEKKLGEILRIHHGKDYKHLASITMKYPVLGSGGVMAYVDKYLCSWECVLIGRKGSIDKPQYMNTPFWCVDTLFYSKPQKNELPLYQYYLFQNINWKKYDESTGVPSLSAKTVESIAVYHPTLPEQQKIADFLSTYDEKIDAEKQILTHWKTIKKALLQQMFV